MKKSLLITAILAAISFSANAEITLTDKKAKDAVSSYDKNPPVKLKNTYINPHKSRTEKWRKENIGQWGK